jgi:hypothetical protein
MPNIAAQDRGPLTVFQQIKPVQPGRHLVAQLCWRDALENSELSEQ